MIAGGAGISPQHLRRACKVFDATRRVLVLRLRHQLPLRLVAALLDRIHRQAAVSVETPANMPRTASRCPTPTPSSSSSQSAKPPTPGPLKRKEPRHGRTLAICNVPESAIVREPRCASSPAPAPEIGVASTKAFTAQLAARSRC